MRTSCTRMCPKCSTAGNRRMRAHFHSQITPEGEAREEDGHDDGNSGRPAASDAPNIDTDVVTSIGDRYRRHAIAVRIEDAQDVGVVADSNQFLRLQHTVL